MMPLSSDVTPEGLLAGMIDINESVGGTGKRKDRRVKNQKSSWPSQRWANWTQENIYNSVQSNIDTYYLRRTLRSSARG